ncbi:hypothetical protein B0T09DRAFT_396726 [Sordaria sp. MPI-SDFR-AT-0083]|nr:hypothetical protein B0T09DRAFT_396726 [Sordaria sp. MPI-SDFR-AT-0083]
MTFVNFNADDDSDHASHSGSNDNDTDNGLSDSTTAPELLEFDDELHDPFDLGDLFDVFTEDYVADSDVSRAALVEVDLTRGIEQLLSSLNNDEKPRFVPHDYLVTVGEIAGEPAFKSIVDPLGRIFLSVIEDNDDLATDLKRSEHNLGVARRIADDRQADFDILNLEHIALKQELEDLKVTMFAAPTGIVACAPLARRVIEDPPAFDGKEKDPARRCEAFRAWKFRIVTAWRVDAPHYQAENVKILRAAMLLGPELLSSIQADLDAMMMEPDKDKWRWKTGVDFMKHLSDRFDNVDLKLDASRHETCRTGESSIQN